MRQLLTAFAAMFVIVSSPVLAGDMPPSQNQQQPVMPTKPGQPAEKEQTKYLLTGCTRSQDGKEEHKQKDMMKKPAQEEAQKKSA